MSLALDRDLLREMHEHLGRAYPEEGCGVLLGREADGRRRITRVIGFENRLEASRRNRYVIAPEQLLQAEREARALELEVLGFFHSHPDHPAQPSAFDLEHAWPYYSYVIVSLHGGRVADSRSWRLADDRAGFLPETLELVAEPDAAARGSGGTSPGEPSGDTR